MNLFLSKQSRIALGIHVEDDDVRRPYAGRLRSGDRFQQDLGAGIGRRVAYRVDVDWHHIPWLEDKFAAGRPDWVAEIISPTEREIDEVVKLEEYALAGIPEYWLLDPDNATIRVYVLEDDPYALSATVSAGQTTRSVTIPGFELAVDDVFEPS